MRFAEDSSGGLPKGFSGTILRCSAIAAAILTPSVTHGQEVARPSLASEAAASLNKFDSATNLYTVQVGPVYLNLAAEMGIEFNDNIDYAETGRRADVILKPVLDLGILWPLAGDNTLAFSGGIGYVDYLRTPNLSHVYIAPDSTTTFKAYSGDFVFDVHDKVSASDYVAQTPTLSGSANYFQIENVSGVGVLWDLNKLILSVGYDYDYLQVLSDLYSFYSHESHLFNQKTTFVLNPTDRAGVEVFGGLTSYDEKILEDNANFSVGPFYEKQLSQYVRAKLAGGFETYMFDPNPYPFAQQKVLNTFYLDAELNHRVNEWFTHRLVASRQVLGTAVTASAYELDAIRYDASISILKNYYIGPRIFFEHGKTYGGPQEIFDRWGAGFYVWHQIAKDLTGSISYDFLLKNSDVAGANYLQNRLALNVRYSF